jgi:hypothetical protein
LNDGSLVAGDDLRFARGLCLSFRQSTKKWSRYHGERPIDRRFADRILESAYRLRILRVFAALVLISLTGIAIFVAPSLLT